MPGPQAAPRKGTKTSRRPGSSPHAAFTRQARRGQSRAKTQRGAPPTRFRTEGAAREPASTHRSGSFLRSPRSRRRRAAAGAREGEQEPGRRVPQSRRVAQARKSRGCQQHPSETEFPRQCRVPKGESARVERPAP